MKQVFSRRGQVMVVDVPAPLCGPGGVLVRTAWSVVSTGTERADIAGQRLLRAGDAKSSVRSVAFGFFDDLSPRYQSRHTVAEVQGWFEASGLADLKQSGLIGMSGTRVN
jgi:hypothetical protein